jgi:hypothetical protein
MMFLIDTDAFCKLGVADLIADTADLFGVKLQDCARLPALPHMLKRGGLARKLGEQQCNKLIPLAEAMRSVEESQGPWLEKMTPIDAIDPGEAQLFAAAADHGFIVLSDDKRAMRELKRVEGLPQALNGRVVVLERVLLTLCERLGTDEVRRRVSSVTSLDTMIAVCFSPGNNDPMTCLESYYRNATSELAPIVLWDPRVNS